MATEKRLVYAREVEEIFNFVEHECSDSYEAFKVAINKATTVDAVEVVHGRWEPELMPTGVEYTGHAEMTVQALSCSVCGKCVDVSESYFSYCPNCGAKMDGDGNG